MTAVAITALAIALAAWPARALADGDPASDVLTETPVYFPADAGIPAAKQAQLLKLVREAESHGYPLRVALIAHRSDLGSIGALWTKPNVYSGFLGTELSLVFHGTLLVVMPNGYGVDVIGEPGAAAKTQAAAAPLIHLAPGGGSGEALADNAIAAVQRITSAAGIPLTLPPRPCLRPPRRAASTWPPGRCSRPGSWCSSWPGRPACARARCVAV